jgi:ActR/RegA family two-component response regulator
MEVFFSTLEKRSAQVQVIEELASGRGTSLSTVARDLVVDALEMQEDIGLQLIAAEREARYAPESADTHSDVWDADVREAE